MMALVFTNDGLEVFSGLTTRKKYSKRSSKKKKSGYEVRKIW